MPTTYASLTPDTPDQATPDQAEAPKYPSWVPDEPAQPTPKDAYEETAHLNPDTAAKVLPIAKQTGEDPNFVEANLPAMEQATRAASKPFQDFFANLKDMAPKSFKVLSDPETMAMTHDDLGNLPTIENMARTAAEGTIPYLKAQLAGVKLAAARAGGFYSALAKMASPQGPGAPSLVSPEDTAFWDKKIAQAEQEHREAAGKLPDSYATRMAESAPMLVGAVGAGIAGGPAGEAAYWANIGFADIFGSVKNTKVNGKPVSDNVAAVAALGGGLVMGGISQAQVMPLARAWLSKVPGGDKFLTNFLATTPDSVLKSASVKGALMNGITDFLKQSGHTGAVISAFDAAQQAAVGGAKLMAGEQLGNLHPLQAALESVQAGAKGALEFGPLTAFGAASGAVKGYQGYEARVQSDVAALTQKTSESLRAAADASKLRARNPERFQKAVDDVLPDSMKTIHIPLDAANVYLQSGNVDQGAFLREMDAEKSYQEATKTGKPLEVPTAKLLGSKHFQALIPDIKYDPDGLTPNEAAAEGKDREAAAGKAKEQAEQTRQQVAADHKDIEDRIAKGDKVMSDRRIQLSETIRADMDPAYRPQGISEGERKEHVDKASQVAASYYINEGARRGVDPEELYHHDISAFSNAGAGPSAQDMVDRDQEVMRQAVEYAASNGGITPVMDAIRKAGGLDLSHATERGYSGELSNLGWSNIFRKGGKSLDKLTEQLKASGVLKEGTPNELFDKLDDESRAIGNFKSQHGEKLYAKVRQMLQQGPVEKQEKLPGAEVQPEMPEGKVKPKSDQVQPEDLLEGFRPDLQGRLFQAAARREATPGTPEYKKAGGFKAGEEGTETPEFVAWFGQSKVVDAQGKPLVVYHGTTHGELDTFKIPEEEDPEYGIAGAFFSKDIHTSEGFTKKAVYDKDAGGKPNLISAYLKLEHPLDMELDAEKLTLEERGWVASVHSETAEDLTDWISDRKEKGLTSSVGKYLYQGGATDLQDMPTDQLYNFDGILDGDVVVAFHPEQINILHQTAWHGSPQAPVFYSNLQRTVEQKMGNSATVEQVKALLRDQKAEEVKWSGIDDFLKGKDKISKPELLDFLRANQVRVKEVTKGDYGNVLTPAEQTRHEDLRNRHLGLNETESEELSTLRAKAGGKNITKFSLYQLPGGENYRELLLTLPISVEKGGIPVPEGYKGVVAFKSSHWDEPNVLAHVRFNDRVDADGKKVLFLEEVQSDWHQKGRKQGYKSGEAAVPLENIQPQEDGTFRVFIEGERGFTDARVNTHEDAVKWLKDRLAENAGYEQSGVPDAPFRKTWHEFALKRMLRYAAENGYDKLAWTTGEQQAERYDLSKVISKLNWYKNEDGTFNITADTKDRAVAMPDQKNVASEKLADIVGKDVADKIIKGEGSREIEADETAYKAVGVLKGLDLKVGGEGMKGFYDKILPDYANKFGKKFGAKVEDIPMDVSGGKPLTGREEHQDGVTTVHSLPITHELRKAAIEQGFPLFQEGQGQPRGFYDAETKVIGLTSKADPATLLHEPAHAWLRGMFEHVQSGQADESYMAHWEPAKKWLGIKDDQTELTRSQQEKFAQGLEGHFMQGKDVPEGMSGLFARFRQWLTGIYQRVRGQQQVPDEMRAFFNRMIAGEDAVKKAVDEGGYNPSEIPDAEGVPEEAKRRVRSMQERAHDEAVEALTKEMMKDVKGNWSRFLEDHRKDSEAAAKEEVKSLPVEQAKADMRGRWKSEDKMRLAAQALLSDKLPEDEAANFAIAAEIHGYPNERELAQDIVNSRSAKDEIKARTDAKMQEFIDMKDRGVMESYAREIVHSQKGTELLALEHQILEGMAYDKDVSAGVSRLGRITASEQARAAREQARDMLAGLPARKSMNPRIYITAERQAAVKVSKALAEGDRAKASEFKRQQMFNHACVSEAIKNAKELGVANRLLDKFAGRGQDLMDMPYGILRHIDGLLANHGYAEARPFDQKTQEAIADDMLKKSRATDTADKVGVMQDIANATGLVRDAQSGKWRPETLPELLDRAQDNYRDIAVQPSMLGDGKKAKEDLTLDEVRDLRDAVKSLAHFGKTFDRYLSDFVQGDMKANAGELAASIDEKIGQKFDRTGLGSKYDTEFGERLAKLKEIPNNFCMQFQDTLLSICDYLDRGDTNGPAKKYVYRLLENAGNDKMRRQRDMHDGYNAVLSAHYTPDELSKYKGEKYTFDWLKDKDGNQLKVSKHQILCSVLNWGNAGGRQRLMDGYNILEHNVQEMFGKLAPKDFDFANDHWAYLQKFWPEIKALEMTTMGIEPKQVEAMPFESPYGQKMTGGYHPLAYDPSKTIEAYKNDEQKNALYKQFSSARAQTDRGHAMARVQYLARPLDLDMRVTFNHLENIVHDLAYRTAIIDLNRFLRNGDVRSAIAGAIDIPGLRRIEKDVQAVAQDQGESLNMADKALNWFRFGSTLQNIGLRPLMFGMKMTTDAIQAVQEIGVSRLVGGMKDVLMDAPGTLDFMKDNSQRMAQRYTLQDSTITDMMRRWSGPEGTLSGLKRYAFIAEYLADRVVSAPLWQATYTKNVGALGHETALNMADEAVTRTMGSGDIIDRSPVQRGAPWMKMTSMYYSFMGTMFNRWRAQAKIAGLALDDGHYWNAAMTLGKATAFQWLMVGASENIWREVSRNNADNDDDKEKMLKRVGVRMAELPFSGVWLLRDVASAGIKKLTGERDSGYTFSPLEDAVDSMVTAVAKGAGMTVNEDMRSEKSAEDVARGMAIALRYPQTINNAAFNFLDWMQNDGDLTWRDLAGQRRIKK